MLLFCVPDLSDYASSPLIGDERPTRQPVDATNMRERPHDLVGDRAEWECSVASFWFGANTTLDVSGGKELYGIGKVALRVGNLGWRSLRGYLRNRAARYVTDALAVGFPAELAQGATTNPGFMNYDNRNAPVIDAIEGIVPGPGTYKSFQDMKAKCFHPDGRP
jgi:hypothetical protein